MASNKYARIALDTLETIVSRLDDKEKLEVLTFVIDEGITPFYQSQFTQYNVVNKWVDIRDRREDSILKFILDYTSLLKFNLLTEEIEWGEFKRICTESMIFRFEVHQAGNLKVYIDEEFRSNLPTVDDIVKLFENNDWLVSLTMFSLYGKEIAAGVKR